MLKCLILLKNHMEKNLSLPYFSVGGDNYDIGFEIGNRFRNQIADVLENNKRLQLLRESEKRKPRLPELVRIGKRCFPQYIQEIEGIADGSNSDLTDIYLRNFYYDYSWEACTTVIFKEPHRIILAHNEDNSKDNLNNCYLLKVEPKSGTPFISLCYAGMAPGNSFAFNTNGIIITNDATVPPDIRIGCPRHLAHRYGLEAESMRDAIERVLFEERASGGSINIVSQSEKRAINIETTALRHCITEVEDKIVHANHYVCGELNSIKRDKKLLRSSISRYEVGLRLLSRVKEKTPQAALDIMSSLENTPWSILRTDEKVGSITLFTVLFDVTSEKISMRIYEPKPNMQENDILLEKTSDDLT